MIQELEPEIIDENYIPPQEQSMDAPVEPEIAPELEEIEEVPETTSSIIPPEKIEELAKLLVTTIVQAIEPDFINKLSEKDNELQNTISERESDRKSFGEKEKTIKKDNETKRKETEGKHKESLKAKDKEISELNKQLKEVQKENKKLLKQVKEALDAQD